MTPNEQQRAIIDSQSKRIVVLACPGSGKTTTLTDKIVKLYNSGVSLKRILSVTFTRKAAQEMLEKISSQIPVSRSEQRNVCTLHSFGCKLLFKYKAEVGLKDDYTVAVKADKREILQEVMESEKISDEILDDFLEFVSSIKNGFLVNKWAFKREQFDSYCQKMILKNLIDIDDYIYLPVKILKKNPLIKNIVSNLFDYVYVDEYQDINKIQNEFLDLIINENTNVLYVGDDDQSIYEFRGSNSDFILEKSSPNSGYDVYYLTTNYRSQKTIVDFSEKILRSLNPETRREKVIIANKTSGTNKPVRHDPFATKEEEINYVVREISNLIENTNIEPKEIAVLCRYTSKRNSAGMMNHPELAEIGKKLNMKGIAASTSTSVEGDATLSKEIKNLSLLLSDLASDELTVSQLELGGQYQFQKRFVQMIDLYNSDNNCDFDTSDDLSALMDKVVENGGGITSSAALQDKFNKLIKSYCFVKEQKEEIKNGAGPSSIITNLILFIKENGYLSDNAENVYEYAMLFAKSAEEEYEGEDVSNQFLEIVKSMEAYLWEQDSKFKDDDCVRLLTAHQSKGLQFDAVFVVGLEAGSFPSFSYDTLDSKSLDNERRLFYVCVTRARELLYLSSTKHAVQEKKELADKSFIYNVPDKYFDNRVSDYKDVNYTIKNNNSLNRQLEAKDQAINKLENDNYVAIAKLQKLEKYIEDLQNQLRLQPGGRKEDEEEIERLKRNISILLEENAGKDDYVKILKSRIESMANHQEQLEKKLSNAQGDVEKDELRQELAKSKREKEEIISREKEYKDKIASLDDLYNEQTLKIKELTGNNADLHEEIERLKRESDESNNRLAENKTSQERVYDEIIGSNNSLIHDEAIRPVISKLYKAIVSDKKYPVVQSSFESGLGNYRSLRSSTYEFLNGKKEQNIYLGDLRSYSFKTNMLNFVKKIIEILGGAKNEISVYPFLKEMRSPSNKNYFYSKLVKTFKANSRKQVPQELIKKMIILYALTITASHNLGNEDKEEFKEYNNIVSQFLSNPNDGYYGVLSSFFEFVGLFIDEDYLMFQIKTL